MKPMHSPRTEMKRGAMLSYATIALTNIVGILLTPFIVRTLGQSEFGLYVLLGSFISYMTVLDFGLTNTVVRFVAKYRANKDREGEEKFLATVMSIYIGISVLVLAVGWGIFTKFDLLFGRSLTPEEFGKARVMYAILIFNIALALPGGAFAAICNGYEHFVYPRTVTIVRYVVRSFLVVGLLLLGGRAVALVILDTLVNLSAIAMNGWYVVTRIKAPIRFRKHDRSMVKKILGYSVWIFVFAIVSQFQWQTGQVVLGIMSGTKLVAIYGIGVTLGTYYSAFSGAISGLFLPRATQMVVAEADTEELTSMMIKIARVLLLILFYVLGAFFLYGKDFITLWVGDEFQGSWLVALLIMVGYTTPLVQSFANSIMEARALLSFKAVLYLSMTIVGALLGALLVGRYGVAGMVSGAVAAWMTSQLIMNVYFHRVLRLNVGRFFRELLGRRLPAFAVVVVVCELIAYHPEVRWKYFVLNMAVYSIAYAFTMYRFAMNPYERDLVLGFVRGHHAPVDPPLTSGDVLVPGQEDPVG